MEISEVLEALCMNCFEEQSSQPGEQQICLWLILIHGGVSN